MGVCRRARGREAEETARRFLEARGYVVLEQNFCCRAGELDLVVQKDNLICFVEVRMRSRSKVCFPLQTITLKKQRRIVLAAMKFLQRHSCAGRALRFDVVSILGQGRSAHIEYLPGAFDAGF
ncbi:MAG: YraN family protein [Cystobacterineae bacterium]|nr:YraN family protein [Cystobacterineae bacterium]